MRKTYVFLSLLFILSFLSSQIMAQAPATTSITNGATGVALSVNEISWTHPTAVYGGFELWEGGRSTNPLYGGPTSQGIKILSVYADIPEKLVDISPVLPLKNNTVYYWYVLSSGVWYEYHFTTYPEIPIYLSWPYDGAEMSAKNVLFSWYVPTGTNGMKFRLQITETPDATEAQWNANTSGFNQAPTTQLNKALTLLSNKLYYWRVVVENTSGQVLGYSSVCTLKTTGGSSITVYPSWPIGDLVYTRRPTLYWFADQYPQGIKYQLKIVLDTDKDGVADDAETVTFIPSDVQVHSNGIASINYKLPELLEGTNYLWQVRAYDPTGLSAFNASGFSPWSEMASFETFSTTPATVEIPEATYPAGIEVYTVAPTLFWFYPGPTTGISFTLQVTGSNYSYSTNVTTLNHKLTNLTPGKTYTWKVIASNGVINRESAEQSFTVVGGSTSKAVAIWPIESVEYTNNPTLIWFLEGSSLGIQGYIIKYSITDPGNWSTYHGNADKSLGDEILTNTPGVNSFKITADLINGATYYWAVSTLVNNLSTVYSTGSFTVFGGPASATPILLMPENTGIVNSTSATLSWFIDGATDGITRYNVKYTDSDDPDVLNAQTAVNPTPLTNKSITLTGLIPGHTYYWKVKSIFGNGPTNSTWSETWSFTVAPGSGGSLVMPAVGGPDDIELNTGNVTLSWRLPVPANQKYDVIIADNPSFLNSKIHNNIDQQNLQLTGLSAKSYFWKVRATDNNGSVTPYSAAGEFVISTPTSVEENEIPLTFNLEQNFPNPFNPNTTIKYAIPEPSHVKVSIFNMLGQEIKTLVNTEKNAGNYSVDWSGDDNSGNKVSSGIYIYKVTAGDNVSSKKMVLLK